LNQVETCKCSGFLQQFVIPMLCFVELHYNVTMVEKKREFATIHSSIRRTTFPTSALP